MFYPLNYGDKFRTFFLAGPVLMPKVGLFLCEGLCLSIVDSFSAGLPVGKGHMSGAGFAVDRTSAITKTLAALGDARDSGSGGYLRATRASRIATSSMLVFAGYYFGAKIGFALTFHPHPVSVLWPPNSILLAALLLTPRRAWWILLLAAFPAHWLVQLQSDVSPRMILCWFISNSCETLIGAGCIRYLIRGPVRLDRLRNVSIFCFFGVFLGPFLSSFVASDPIASRRQTATGDRFGTKSFISIAGRPSK